LAENRTDKVGEKLEKLVATMALLRGPGGCPWDAEQTHESLRQYLLEETHEVLDALDAGDKQHLKEELGDLLLQIVFHAQLANESSIFDLADVIEAISEKLIRRHPNVFGDTKIDTAAQQSVNWEKIKKSEGKLSTIDGVPKTLSALLRAWRIQQKAATVGFDWPSKAPVWDKVREELAEFETACENQNADEMEDEFGDLLFSLVNLSRFIKVNPEDALRRTTEKFIRRFRLVEKHFEQARGTLEGVSLAEMDAVWQTIKDEEKTGT